jgi:hypothetical protein
MTKKEIFTHVYLSLLPKMTLEIKEAIAGSEDLEQANNTAVEYSDIAKAVTFGWEIGMDLFNDMDLEYHAVGSGREQTASTADLYQAYPKQATEAEVPPVTDDPEDV